MPVSTNLLIKRQTATAKVVRENVDPPTCLTRRSVLLQISPSFLVMARQMRIPFRLGEEARDVLLGLGVNGW